LQLHITLQHPTIYRQIPSIELRPDQLPQDVLFSSFLLDQCTMSAGGNLRSDKAYYA